MHPGRWALAAVLVLGVVSCSDDEPAADPEPERTADSPTPTESVSPSPTESTDTPPPTATSPTETPPVIPGPARFDPDAAMRTVRHLAGQIGPREAASRDFRRAAGWVADRLTGWGYDVRREPLRVPAGVSWGVPVDAGRTWNVIAATSEPQLQPGEPYLIVGAHLDTVPQAPGAEDNASGISVLLELARLAAGTPPRLPVVFIAFGGEEPRGEGDDDHHFGSQKYVADMSARQRRSLEAMVSLDRVGVGSVVPVCIGGLEPPTVRRSLLRTAGRTDIPAQPCENQASDHWSFDKAGMPAARIGSTPYAEYHSAADRPGVVQQRQLTRVGRLMWEWLSGRGS